MEEKQAAQKTSENPKRPTIDVAPASLAPSRPEPTRQGTQGLRDMLGRTKSKSNEPEDIRPEPTVEAPVVPLKTELNYQRVCTHFVRVVVEY